MPKNFAELKEWGTIILILGDVSIDLSQKGRYLSFRRYFSWKDFFLDIVKAIFEFGIRQRSSNSFLIKKSSEMLLGFFGNYSYTYLLWEYITKKNTSFYLGSYLYLLWQGSSFMVF